MQRLTLSIALTALAALAAAPAGAQQRGPQHVPPGHLPPAGLCRIWYEGLPPGRQPGPMSCAEAERRAPRNARVIYGPRTGRDDGRWDDRRDDRRDGGRWDGRRDDRRDDDDDRWDDRRDGRDGRWDDRRDGRDGRWDDRYEGRRRVGEGDPRRRDDDRCRVRDRAGRCIGGTVSLPYMLDTRMLQQNRRTVEAERWLDGRAVRVRFSDADRNGRPEQIWWLDGGGRVVQQWIDDDRNGRANRVVLYQNGRVLRVVS